MIVIKKVGRRQYIFEVKAWNSETVATSCSFKSVRKCVKAIKRIREEMGTKVSVYDGAGGWGFLLKDGFRGPWFEFVEGDGREVKAILHSQFYKKALSRDNGMESVVKNINTEVLLRVSD